jgi:hypothetical protein
MQYVFSFFSFFPTVLTRPATSSNLKVKSENNIQYRTEFILSVGLTEASRKRTTIYKFEKKCVLNEREYV